MGESKFFNLITVALKKQATLILRDFGEIEFLIKNPEKALLFANNTQSRITEYIQKDISKFKKNYSLVYPDNSFVENEDNSNVFIIHGIIGFENFARGNPHFCIGLSLERDKQIYACGFYNPITNELFFAESSCGAFFNQKRIRKQDLVKNKNKQIIATDKFFLKNNNNINLENDYIITGCPILDICYITVNKFDSGFFSSPINYYSAMAVILLANESNMKVTKEIDNNVNIKNLSIM